MKKKNLFYKWRKAGFALAILMLFTLFSGNAIHGQSPVKNVLLVHGAFTDGSRWKALYELLAKKGYHVTIVQKL
jgi:hypothetical protein